MLDTGSNRNVISKTFCENFNISIVPKIVNALGFSGDLQRSIGTATLMLNFQHFTLPNIEFTVFEKTVFPILISGSTFSSVNINYPNAENSEPYVKLNGHITPSKFGAEVTISTNMSYFVPNNSLRFFNLGDFGPISDLNYICNPVENKGTTGLRILPVICRANNVFLAVENPNPFSLTIPKNCPIYSAAPDSISALISVDDEISENKRLVDHNNWRETNFKVSGQKINVPMGPNINKKADRKKRLDTIINSHKLAFSVSNLDIGLIRGYRYEMKLKPDAKVWFQAPRKISPEAQEKVSEIFRDEVQFKLLEEGPSEYSVPLVLVRKTNGDYRVCHDLRQANQNIIVERYPIPDISCILNQISNQIALNSEEEIFVTKYDMRGAYRQLGVIERDQNKFAFVSGNRMYKSLRMPFGVADAPSTWSQLMNLIFSDLPTVYCYLDDLVQISVGFENLVKDVQNVLKKCEQFGIALSPEKCLIGSDQADILGFNINQKGISLNTDKVSKLIELKCPKNRDQVRSILGSFNYYREFCPNLIRTLQPLYSLLRKNTIFTWAQPHDKAFAEAKQIISKYVTRVHRNPKLDLVLCCDASGTGTGAVLNQRTENGMLEPLNFYSKNFSDSEKKYPIRTRELLAIYFAIKNFEHVLMCSKFFVHSDHKSLEFFRNTKANALSGRVLNILNYLTRFDFKITYVPGKDPKMLTADVLSRAEQFACRAVKSEVDDLDCVHDDIRSFQINSVSTAGPFTLKYIKEFQHKDAHLAKLIKNPKTPYFVNSDGILMRTLKDRSLLVIPECLVGELVNFAHCKRGHLGGAKLHHVLRIYFSAKTLRFECNKVASYCESCLAVKYVPKMKTHGPDLPDVGETPFDKVYTDIIDFGTKCEKNFRYGLSYMCSLSRFCEVVPMEDKTPKSTVQALITLFARFGIPNRLISDNGLEFKAELTQTCFNHFGVYVSHISPLRPQGNAVERFHRNLGEMYKILEIPITKWSIYLPLLVFQYNSSPMNMLGMLCPFEVLFLRAPRPPLELTEKSKFKNWGEINSDISDKIFTEVAQIHRIDST